MSDIRFKISGDSTPFLAELYKETVDTGSFIKSQMIEYSGITDVCNNHTCVIFNGLSQDTNYEVKVIDAIKNNTCLAFTTPSNPEIINPEPTEFNINLLGTVEEESGFEIGTGAVIKKYITGDKYVDISPALEQGECLNLNFTAKEYVSNNNPLYGITNVTNIYKRCGISGDYNFVGYTNDTPFSIQMGEGDSVCYDLYTEIELNANLEQEACAKLVLNDVQEVSGFDYGINSTIINDGFDFSIYNGTTTTTTTSSTTISPTYTIITPTNLWFDEFNSFQDVTIETNGYNYNIGNHDNWISTFKVSSETLRIQVSDNTGGDRLGSVIVHHSEDNNVTSTIGVFQSAGNTNIDEEQLETV